jgi:hypothetical protein
MCAQRGEHLPPADPEHVGGDRRQLDIRRLQHLVQPVDLLRPLLHQRLAVAGQLAQLADRRRRDEAGPEQAVAQQVGQPLAVLDVGLAAGHGLDVLGVDQHDGAPLPLQQVEDRLPEDAGALQRDVRDAERVEPVRQRQQVRRHRREGAHLLAHPAVLLGDQDAHHHRPLVDIEPAASRVHHLHRIPPTLPSASRVVGGDGCVGTTTFLHVLAPTGAATIGYPGRTRVSLPVGLAAPNRGRPGRAAHHGQCATNFHQWVCPHGHRACLGGLPSHDTAQKTSLIDRCYKNCMTAHPRTIVFGGHERCARP